MVKKQPIQLKQQLWSNIKQSADYVSEKTGQFVSIANYIQLLYTIGGPHFNEILIDRFNSLFQQLKQSEVKQIKNKEN